VRGGGGWGGGCPADRNVASSDVPVAPAGLGMAGIVVAPLAFLGVLFWGEEGMYCCRFWEGSPWCLGVGRTLVVPGWVCTVVFYFGSALYRSGSWNREVHGEWWKWGEIWGRVGVG
jgi:hypothetical protein